MPTIASHRPSRMEIRYVAANANYLNGFHVLTMTDDRGDMDIYTTSLRARAIAHAFNSPAPDLLAAIDPRLNEVEQIANGEFRYRGHTIDSDDWFRDDATTAQHLSIFAAMDSIDEYLAEMEGADPQHHAAMEEMAGDDRAHALREERDEMGSDRHVA